MREIVREYCVCKKCGFGYAQIKNHLCYTVQPPIYVAQYHCPACKFDGEVKESEVFRKVETIGKDDGFTSDFIMADPIPMPQVVGECNDPMPQILNEEMIITGKQTTSISDGVKNDTYINLPKAITRQQIEKIEEFLKKNNISILNDADLIKIESMLNDNDLIKCIKLMKFCGVNDLGALQNGDITQEEYDFMHQIFSKIEGDK